LTILARERNQEINELNKNTVKATEANNESLRAIIMHINSDKLLKSKQSAEFRQVQISPTNANNDGRLDVNGLANDNTNYPVSNKTKYTRISQAQKPICFDLLLSACNNEKPNPSKTNDNDNNLIGFTEALHAALHTHNTATRQSRSPILGKEREALG
jgi:hypothetical protein